MNKIFKFILALSLALYATMASALVVPYASVSFVGINADQEDLSGQLLLDVYDLGSVAQFVFSNNIGIPSNITTIYFDDATNLLGGISVANQSAGVDFAVVSPGNFPEGNTLSPSFNEEFQAERTNGPGGVARGINAPGEFLSLNASLVGLTSVSDVLAAINAGNLRIGLHVQAIGNEGGSDSYVTEVRSPSAVPLPAAAWLFASGLGFFGVARRRLNK
jgi:hypothetical protein